MTDFSMFAGDDKTVEITVKNAAGEIVDITGYSIAWTASPLPFGLPSITKAGVVIDGPTGRFNVVLVPADTAALSGNLFHYAKLTSGGLIQTIALGVITVRPGPGVVSVEMFKARFPEFVAVSDALVQMVIDEAAPQVGTSWLDRDRSPALLYLVAHILSAQGYPGVAGGGSGGISGTVKRRKVGDTEVEFFGVATAAGGAGGSLFGSTSYGKQYLIYLRRNFSAIAVV